MRRSLEVETYHHIHDLKLRLISYVDASTEYFYSKTLICVLICI